MITNLFNENIFKILSFFSLSPGSKFNRNEIKGRVMLNNIPLDKTLTFLLNSNILKTERKLYSINFNNEYSKFILELVSKQYKYLKEIPFRIYLVIIDMINKLSSQKNVELYLFGSYSKLIYKENSDIDLAILNGKITNLNGKITNNFIDKLEKKYGVVIETHFFDKDKFYSNKKDPLIKDIIKNGVKLI